jgi:hypothetical protein
MGTDGHDRDERTPVLTEAVQPDAAAEVPILQDAVTLEADPTPEAQLEALQAELTAVAHELTERLLHAAVREMEAALFQEVSDRLREELPAIVERVLRDHLKTGR